MEIPAQNNIYGLLVCDQRLRELAQLLGRLPDIRQQQVEIKTSSFDGSQKLLVRTETAEFDCYPTGKKAGEFLFNGAVAGDSADVCSFAKKLHEALRSGGFEPKIEVYDECGKCVAELES